MNFYKSIRGRFTGMQRRYSQIYLRGEATHLGEAIPIGCLTNRNRVLILSDMEMLKMSNLRGYVFVSG